MVTSRREKHRLRAVTLRHLEPQHVAVKAKRALQVRDLQMDVSDADAGIDAHGEMRRETTGTLPVIGAGEAREDRLLPGPQLAGETGDFLRVFRRDVLLFRRIGPKVEQLAHFGAGAAAA